MPSKRRQRELARQRYERRRQEEARRRAARRRRNAIIVSVVAVLAVAVGGTVGVAALVSNDKKAGLSTKAAPTPSANAAPGSCVYQSEGKAARPVTPPPSTGIDRTHDYVATMKTNRGTVRMALFGSKAPCTVNAFKSLAAQKYFDNTSCHRVTAGGLNVLQCGDPTGTGGGGPGYQYADENLTGATYTAGTVAMANAGPGTNGSQFFLVYADSTLPPSYTVFGKVTAGLDVVKAIAAKGSTPAGDGKPKETVTIESFTVARA